MIIKSIYILKYITKYNYEVIYYNITQCMIIKSKYITKYNYEIIY